MHISESSCVVSLGTRASSVWIVMSSTAVPPPYQTGIILGKDGMIGMNGGNKSTSGNGTEGPGSQQGGTELVPDTPCQQSVIPSYTLIGLIILS